MTDLVQTANLALSAIAGVAAGFCLARLVDWVAAREPFTVLRFRWQLRRMRLPQEVNRERRAR